MAGMAGTAPGGGIRAVGDHLGSAYPVITNTTIYSNWCSSNGGGLYTYNNAGATVTNCIVWDNTAVMLGPEMSIEGALIVNIDYSCIRSWLVNDPGLMCLWSPSNIAPASPGLFSPATWDFHLTFGSPCRNAGTNAAIAIQEDDFEGDPRTAEGVADMGADEFHVHLYYTGNFVPNGVIQFNLVATPGAGPLLLCFGSGILDPPMNTPYGPWYLAPPYFWLSLPFTVPASGILVFPGILPPTPGPYAVHTQAIVMDGTPKATNLGVIYVP
jgi:hypothetical protein